MKIRHQAKRNKKLTKKHIAQSAHLKKTFKVKKIRGLAMPIFEKKKITGKKYHLNYFLKSKKGVAVGIILLSLFSLESSFLGQFSYFFRASLLDMKPIEFTGTVFPVEKVPNWAALDSSERNKRYDQIDQAKFIPIPDYNTSLFQKGKDSLQTLGNEQAKNAFLTFSVPYLGNYEFDGTENTGSHSGVDIKVPIGTPVESIANGLVYKAEKNNSGFGNFITISHIGIPDSEHPGKKTTIYSTYGHLSEINVKVGDEVKKGQVIGKSGDSGLATAPHVHFQIDRSDAPFIPYWPFTWNEATSHGYSSTFDAVRNGLGKSNAIQYTMNPMTLVAKFENFVDATIVVDTSATIPTVEKKNDTTKNDLVIHTDTSTTTVTPKAKTTIKKTVAKTDTSKTIVKQKNDIVIANNDDGVVFEPTDSYIPGKEKTMHISVPSSILVATAGIQIESTLRELAQVTPNTLSAKDFVNGMAELKVKTDSNQLFKLIAKGEFGEVKSKTLRPTIFEDVPTTDKNAEAIQYLKDMNIVTGYADGTFHPDSTLNRAEATKLLITANKIVLEKTKKSAFKDVALNEWYSDYINTIANKKIVQGYPDGSFRPNNQIARSEFLKLAISLSGLPAVNTTLARNPYLDVDKSAWFAPYFELSKTYSLLPARKGGFMVPSQPITRAEAAVVLYGLSKIK